MDGNLSGRFGSCKAYARNSTSKLITHANRMIIKPPKISVFSLHYSYLSLVRYSSQPWELCLAEADNLFPEYLAMVMHFMRGI